MKLFFVLTFCAIASFSMQAADATASAEPPAQAATNILREGNFDKCLTRGPRHWGYYQGKEYYGWSGGMAPENNTKGELDKTCVVSAPNSLKLSSDKTSYTIEQTLTGRLKPNTTYRISCMVKLENVVAIKPYGGFKLNLWDDSNRWFEDKNVMLGTCDWKKITFIHKTSANLDPTKRSYFRVWLLYATGTAWVDDIVIEEVK